MNELRINYRHRPDTTPKAELSALIACYHYVLNCKAKKEGGPATAPDDGTKIKEDSANESIIPK